MTRPVTAIRLQAKVALVLWALVLLLPASLFGLDLKALKPTGYVNDFAGVMDAGGKQTLENYCANVERATGAQMTIVVLPTLDDEDIDTVTNDLYRQWGVGKKGKDEGLMIMLAIREHKYRAEVGYGLEPYITDADAGTVMRGVQPILRQGNYAGALLAAAEQFGNTIAQAKGVAIDGAEPLPRLAERDSFHIPLPLIFIGIIILIALMNRGNRGGGIGPRGGGGGGFLPGLILGNMMGRGGGWGGGGFGGGGGGGGFGGFGGGDSGGGGASGGW